MGSLFEDNKSEPPDIISAVLSGIQQGVRLGLFIGKGFLWAGQAADAALRATQERAERRPGEEQQRRQPNQG